MAQILAMLLASGQGWAALMCDERLARRHVAGGYRTGHRGHPALMKSLRDHSTARHRDLFFVRRGQADEVGHGSPCKSTQRMPKEDSRKQTLERVKALLAITVVNGSTPSQAASARRKARQIMAANHITRGEVGHPSKAQVDAAGAIVEGKTAGDLNVNISRRRLPDDTYIHSVVLAGRAYGRLSLPVVNDEAQAKALAEELFLVLQRRLSVVVRRGR